MPRGGGAASRILGLVVVLAIACALPFMMSGFRVFQFTQVYIYAIALLGLNILTGYNGQISLGHGAFYAIGAYTTAIMIDKWNIGYGWTIPTAGILCLVIGFLFGRPALRLEGLYLALATFSLALAVPQILKYFEHWTGGSQGIGLATISGAIFGALFIQFVPNWAQDISKAAPWAIFGIFLIVFMYVMPHGIVGFLRLAWIRMTRPAVTGRKAAGEARS